MKEGKLEVRAADTARPSMVAVWLLCAMFSLMLLRPPALDGAKAADTLTVATLNLWNNQHDWPSRLEVIVAGLRRLRPDVICL
jgi:hypothetical protein